MHTWLPWQRALHFSANRADLPAAWHDERPTRGVSGSFWHSGTKWHSVLNILQPRVHPCSFQITASPFVIWIRRPCGVSSSLQMSYKMFTVEGAKESSHGERAYNWKSKEQRNFGPQDSGERTKSNTRWELPRTKATESLKAKTSTIKRISSCLASLYSWHARHPRPIFLARAAGLHCKSHSFRQLQKFDDLSLYWA